MTPTIRKLMLTAHVLSTVGWMGAIAAFLALAVIGLTSHETRLVDSSYVAMKLIGWRVIVPLGLASLITGLVQSLGTTWGLFRHYWVLLKFVLTVVATVLLLLHMTAANRLADAVSQTVLVGARLQGLRIQIMADAGAAVLLLIVNTVLSMYKPRGMTQYGLRKQRARYPIAASEIGVLELDKATAPLWVKVFGITAFLLLVLFRVVLLHISGGGGGHHFHREAGKTLQHRADTTMAHNGSRSAASIGDGCHWRTHQRNRTYTLAPTDPLRLDFRTQS
jgi:hypothetical protein